MKHFLMGLLVMLVCTGGVQANPEFGCSDTPSSLNLVENVGTLYMTGLPDSGDIRFVMDMIPVTPTYESLPSPMQATKGYRLIPKVGLHIIQVKRTGYAPFTATVTMCYAKCTFMQATMLPEAVAVTTTITPSGSGSSVIKPGGISAVTLKTTTPVTTTPGLYSSQLHDPTIAANGATTSTTTTVTQVSGSQAGGSGSQNTGTGATGDGLTGSTPSGSSQTGSVQSGSSQTGSAQSGSSQTGSQQQGPANAGSTDSANTGSLSVTTTPAGVSIFIDGVQRGVSPAIIPGLTPGDHTLLLKLDGYTDLSTPVSITAGKTTEYTTGLAKTARSSPGFEFILALAAMGAVLFTKRRQ
jgi:hypothetical protein